MLHVLQNRPFWAKNGCFSGCRRNTAMMRNQITSILIFCLLSFFHGFLCIFLLSFLSHFLIAACIPPRRSIERVDCGLRFNPAQPRHWPRWRHLTRTTQTHVEVLLIWCPGRARTGQAATSSAGGRCYTLHSSGRCAKFSAYPAWWPSSG